MKRILVITPFFYPHTGGSERYMEDLYVFLKRKHTNICVDVLCYNTDNVKEKEEYKGLNIYRIPCWTILAGQFCLPKFFPLLKFLKNHNSYDLIHSSTRFFDSSWWAPVYAKLIKAKVVLTDHCAYHPVSSNSFINLMVKIIEVTIVRLFLHLYDEIYSQNKKTREFLKKTFKVDSQLAYPGLSFKLNSFKLRIINKKIKAVYVGRMIESKGVKTLFEIAMETTEINFVLAGDGPLVEQLKETITREKLRNISILGNLSRKEVLGLLKSADIFVYPSWHSEGLPLALLEAGESGLAVLATDSGAISELIKDKETGILVAPKNKKAFKDGLDKLIKDKLLRQKLAKNLYDYAVRNFFWDNSVGLVVGQLR
ncbi:glycosyltransferase family 4 protein [Candidatus Roizmanbacteria bacterium]|nr:glycosyltransferase family 4 protein [Candidatus Roizmanbacteria bacterium]